MLNFVRSYGVPLLMVVVALHQIIRVQAQGLCSWRGGGFGMYASFHPRHHEAWVTHKETGEKVRYAKYDDNSDTQYIAIRPVLTWPTDRQAGLALERIPPEERSPVELRVYRLDFDPNTGRLTRQLLASAPQPDAEEGGPDNE